MALDRGTQPIVKDSSGVLVGVAQVRVGLASKRAAGVAITGTPVPVGKSLKVFTSSDATVYCVKPQDIYADNAGTATFAATGTYTGKIDGAFIVRAVDATNVDVFSPYGYMETKLVSAFSTATPLNMVSGTVSGVSLQISTPSAIAAGDTWVIPVFTASVLDMSQTGIVSPYSLFKGPTNSVGGVKSATFSPKIDGIKKLESGFPSYVADQILDKVSVEMQWNGLEYNNANLQVLKSMMNKVINEGELPSVSIEYVMRTRGGKQISFWVPSATFTSLPSISPSNDYSDVAYSMTGLKQTEFTVDPTTQLSVANDLARYNAWLNEAPIYRELNYIH